jgi:hypothetical protein
VNSFGWTIHDSFFGDGGPAEAVCVAHVGCVERCWTYKGSRSHTCTKVRCISSAGWDSGSTGSAARRGRPALPQGCALRASDQRTPT